jgi:glycine/D-amino acid oxidase-like deaminating enzyme
MTAQQARSRAEADIAVIGAGFFGCEIALALRDLGFERVVLLEREHGIFRRASYVNQARVHNGYHYPRALATAARSHANFERFLADYDYAIHWAMEKVYAIAYGSKVNPTQFERTCAAIGAPCISAPIRIARLFDDDLIDAVFLTREFALDANRIAQRTIARLQASGIDLRLSTPARVRSIDDRTVTLDTGQGPLSVPFVVNATYADLDGVGIRIRSELKRELAELVLIRPPRPVAGLGITVMDGPFFSVLPYPPMELHSLSHVRFTPHLAWTAAAAAPPVVQHSNAERMLRDASRYIPCLSAVEPETSLFEVKAVLPRHEKDDGRPILFETSPDSPRIVSVMGAKIDNIYDAIDAIRSYSWHQ